MNNDLFEKAPVPKAYFILAGPVVLSMVVSLVYNMVDTYFIAQTGNTDLVAGVSLGAPVFTLMVALGDIFGLGGSSVISRLFGQKRDAEGKRLSAFCFWASVGLGLVMAAAMLLFRAPILALLGAEGGALPYASDYYTVMALGAPIIIALYTPTNVLRTEGFATPAMVGSVLGTVINIVLNVLFVSVLGWGAAGSAGATVIGNGCALAFLVVFTVLRSQKLSVSPKGIGVSGEELKELLAIGIPASITNLMQSIGVALTNRFLVAYGTNAVAAMGIALKVNMISVLVLVGFAFGAQPLVGYNYGAKNRERLHAILKFSYGFMCALAAALSVGVIVAAQPLVSFFMNDPAIVELGVPMLRLQQISMVAVAIVMVTTCVFQSAGKALGAFLLSVSRQGVVFALVIVVASAAFGLGGVMCAQAVSDLLTAIMAAVLFKQQLGNELAAGA